MKTMTCKQLGGACDVEFHAETFEQMATLSQEHAKEMMQTDDTDHLHAMSKMKELMKDPEAMGTWMQSKRDLFTSLPNN